MHLPVLRWPVERPLGMLLQTPAHRVMRVLQVTQAQWRHAEALVPPVLQPGAALPAEEVALSA